MLSIHNYNFQNWNEKFDDVVHMDELQVNRSWQELFNPILESNKFIPISAALTEEMQNFSVFPYPDLVFNSFNKVNLEDIKVMIIGQDPYPQSSKFPSQEIPQAMGLSFSVPYGMDVPVSLQNIYKNMKKFKHIYKMPSHGNLEFWATQGCFMYNTYLTVRQGHPNSHERIWKSFSDKVIKYISKENKNVIFVLWGKDALNKLPLIDTDEHEVIISSHPSGLSCSSTLGAYPSFNENDHFGKINTYLQEKQLEQIIWQL